MEWLVRGPVGMLIHPNNISREQDFILSQTGSLKIGFLQSSDAGRLNNLEWTNRIPFFKTFNTDGEEVYHQLYETCTIYYYYAPVWPN
jgi:hypothetical protein